MNRIKKKFNALSEKGEKALIAYIMAGDPNLSETERIVLELEKSGADLIELGVPFSDPVADGPTIQKAAERALLNGVSLQMVLERVVSIRKKSKIPILLMTYLNPVCTFGIELFFKEARQSFVDGVIIPDLPLEEAMPFLKWSRRYQIDLIFLVAPTTPMERISKIVTAASGFIYYVSLTGITGAAINKIAEVTENISKVKSKTHLPVAAGFGISNEAEAKEISRISDGVIIGSLFVKTIETAPHDPLYLERLSQQTIAFKKALR
ncbi:MAG: tryptophan synthase subunit alpha [Nitrospirota bacterium]